MVSVLKRNVGLFVVASLLVILSACGMGVSQGNRGPSGATDGKVNVTVDTFMVEADVTTVKSGPITFDVHNRSALPHEMLVVRVGDLESVASTANVAAIKGRTIATGEGAAEELLVAQLMGQAYDRITSRLVEEQIDSLGEVADLEGGHTGSVTLDLPPGQYMLLCNITAHFQSGMHTAFVVTP